MAKNDNSILMRLDERSLKALENLDKGIKTSQNVDKSRSKSVKTRGYTPNENKRRAKMEESARRSEYKIQQRQIALEKERRATAKAEEKRLKMAESGRRSEYKMHQRLNRESAKEEKRRQDSFNALNRQRQRALASNASKQLASRQKAFKMMYKFRGNRLKRETKARAQFSGLNLRSRMGLGISSLFGYDKSTATRSAIANAYDRQQVRASRNKAFTNKLIRGIGTFTLVLGSVTMVFNLLKNSITNVISQFQKLGEAMELTRANTIGTRAYSAEGQRDIASLSNFLRRLTGSTAGQSTQQALRLAGIMKKEGYTSRFDAIGEVARVRAYETGTDIETALRELLRLSKDKGGWSFLAREQMRYRDSGSTREAFTMNGSSMMNRMFNAPMAMFEQMANNMDTTGMYETFKNMTLAVEGFFSPDIWQPVMETFTSKLSSITPERAQEFSKSVAEFVDGLNYIVLNIVRLGGELGSTKSVWSEFFKSSFTASEKLAILFKSLGTLIWDFVKGIFNTAKWLIKGVAGLGMSIGKSIFGTLGELGKSLTDNPTAINPHEFDYSTPYVPPRIPVQKMDITVAEGQRIEIDTSTGAVTYY